MAEFRKNLADAVFGSPVRTLGTLGDALGVAIEFVRGGDSVLMDQIDTTQAREAALLAEVDAQLDNVPSIGIVDTPARVVGATAVTGFTPQRRTITQVIG